MREREQAVRALLDRPGLQKLFSALAGDEVRVVGGAVRNALLGEPVADIDLAVAAVPRDVLGKAEGAGLRVVPTGIDHGTLTLIVDGAHFEITSLREDVETDGRRAKVRFGGDFAADARRRDFTINALSVDARGQLHDYVGGLDDLAARRVRFIGDPEQRIAEDYLRILRFFRFSACYGEGPLDPDGLARLHRPARGNRDPVARAARRGNAEDPGVAALRAPSSRPWRRRPARFPGRRALARRGRRVAAILAAHGASDALLSLAALALHSECDAERLAEALRLSNAQKRRLARHGQGRRRLAWRRDSARAGAIARTAFPSWRAGGARRPLLIQAEVAAAPDELGFLARRRFLRDTPPPQPPFAATDLIARGIRQGAGLGAR